MTIPRRDRIDLFTPAERAIWDATQAVEQAGCDVRLTAAVNLLHEARAQVADYVDGVKHEPKPFGHISKADECQVDQPRCGHCNSENCTEIAALAFALPGDAALEGKP